MPTPEIAEAAPWWAQYAAGLTAAGSLLGIFVNAYRKSREKEPDLASRMMADKSAMIDLKPFTEAITRIVQATEGTREDVHEALIIARKEAQDDQVERMAEQRAEQIIARERKAYESRFQEDVARRITRLPSDPS